MKPSPLVSMLLAAVLLTSGCAAVTPGPGGGRSLGYTPTRAGGPGEEVGGSIPWSVEESGTREEEPGPRSIAEPGRHSVRLARQALRGGLEEVTGTKKHLEEELRGLESGKGITRINGIFLKHVGRGVHELGWMEDALGGARRLEETARGLGEPGMELSLLRMAGPRLQAAMFGTLLLSAWLDFLHLLDVVLERYRWYSVERLVVVMDRLWRMVAPTMRALATLEEEKVEATVLALPGLMGQLSQEFDALEEDVRVATERTGQMLLVGQAVEMATTLSAMRLAVPRMPRGPLAAPALGVGLVMGSNGVMMGTRVVVTAEWVERMGRLVRAGVLSLPTASAAVRIHAGQPMLSQASHELPKGVREALGDGPEVRGMHQTGKAGAGMSEPPRHHVLVREHRAWFEKRGFTGEMDIDNFCVRLELAHHQAVHGGGNWRLGRTWPGEWNRMIMKALRNGEARAGRTLTRDEILKIVAEYMKEYDIPMNFTRWSGR